MKIIKEINPINIIQQSYNINQLGKAIKIDYKALPHHIHLLENNLITESGEKYGKPNY
jgi:lipopolysaccharide export system protein LptA